MISNGGGVHVEECVRVCLKSKYCLIICMDSFSYNWRSRKMWHCSSKPREPIRMRIVRNMNPCMRIVCNVKPVRIVRNMNPCMRKVCNVKPVRARFQIGNSRHHLPPSTTIHYAAAAAYWLSNIMMSRPQPVDPTHVVILMPLLRAG